MVGEDDPGHPMTESPSVYGKEWKDRALKAETRLATIVEAVRYTAELYHKPTIYRTSKLKWSPNFSIGFETRFEALVNKSSVVELPPREKTVPIPPVHRPHETTRWDNPNGASLPPLHRCRVCLNWFDEVPGTDVECPGPA